MRRGLILAAIVAVGTLSVSVSALQQLNQGAVDGAQIEQVKGNLYVITKTNMEGMSNFQGANAKYLPKRTFDDRLTLGSGADRDLSSRYPGRFDRSIQKNRQLVGRSTQKGICRSAPATAERNMSI